jgi:hypothetical protein
MRENDCAELVSILKDILANFKAIDSQVGKDTLLIVS